ncbi:MAG: hypothetical protein V5A29_09060 [Haloarculaceae archaeon]
MFTPELWDRMSGVMRSIAESYKHSAIRAAKLMERAYNFETDSDVGIVRSEYNPGFVEGLLGADMLLQDVESFTSRLLAETRRKETRVKDVLSLANEYPIAFYEFQRTGRLTVETSLHDFDRRHPGLYGQRLDAVEVEVVGLLPPEGVTGTLQRGIVSRYRSADGGERTRIHGTDTMALSEYELRDDAYLFRQDARIQGLFEGHGVGATWDLSLPKRSNNLDYARIVDVRLVFYYTARFSDLLEASVRSRANSSASGTSPCARITPRRGTPSSTAGATSASRCSARTCPTRRRRSGRTRSPSGCSEPTARPSVPASR